MAKLYTPRHTTGRTGIKSAKLSSHLVKPVHFKSSSIKIKAPKFSRGRTSSTKIKI